MLKHFESKFAVSSQNEESMGNASTDTTQVDSLVELPVFRNAR